MNKKGVSLGIALSIICLAFLYNTPDALSLFSKRLWGNDRYMTAVAISQYGWEKSEYAVIARGDDFADALCAGPLAKKYDAPILLTEPEVLDYDIVQELIRLEVDNVIIIGGPGAVSLEVENSLKSFGIMKVRRIWGEDRYETAVRIAEELGTSTGAVLASGHDFPDALSISSIASILNMPVMLTERDSLPYKVKEFIYREEFNKVYIIGGTGVISSNVEDSVPNPVRLGGSDRYETNARVVEEFEGQLNFSCLYVAVGDGPGGNEFADALSGAVLAAKSSSPVILVHKSLTEVTGKLIRPRLAAGSRVIALGGVGAVPERVLEEILSYGNEASEAGLTWPYNEGTPDSGGFTENAEIKVSTAQELTNALNGNYTKIILEDGQYNLNLIIDRPVSIKALKRHGAAVNGNITIQCGNVIIDGLAVNAPPGASAGISAVLVDTAGTGIEIKNNDITSYKNGITILKSSAAAIDSNIIRGSENSGFTTYGIQVGSLEETAGAINVTINNNTIWGNRYTGSDSTDSCGILLKTKGTVAVGGGLVYSVTTGNAKQAGETLETQADDTNDVKVMIVNPDSSSSELKAGDIWYPVKDEAPPPGKLPRPVKPYFEDGIALWLPVENEKVGYSLQLYKDGTPSGQPVIVAHGEELAYDFNNAVTGIGNYTVTVKALGSGEYSDSDESEQSDSYSDYISQFNIIKDTTNMQLAMEDARLMLSLGTYNTLSPLGKYLAAEGVLNGRGGGYEDKEAIQAVLDSKVNSLTIPEGSVRSLVYACSGTAADSMKIAIQTDYGNTSGIDDRIKVDGKISFSLPFTSDVDIQGFIGDNSIGTITLEAGSSHFWLNDFVDGEERPALNTKADKTEVYTFIIENIPEELNGAATTLKLSTIASVPGHFDDAAGMWTDGLSSDSMDVNIGSDEKPDEIYVDNRFKSGVPGWEIIRFNDIHDAVAYAPEEGIVHIGNGTYNLTDSEHKQLVINKKVTIKGEGKDSTILYVYSAPYNVVGVIYVNNTTGFNLYDLTIDGGNKSFSYAVYATGGHVDIENVRIKNINNDKYGTGIRINNNTSGYPEMLNVNGCSFENISRCGVFISGAEADIGTRSPNTFAGGYTAGSDENNSQSAIYVSGGEANIENNIISGYNKPDSAGIYIVSGTVKVKNNTISDCTVEIKGAIQE